MKDAEFAHLKAGDRIISTTTLTDVSFGKEYTVYSDQKGHLYFIDDKLDQNYCLPYKYGFFHIIEEKSVVDFSNLPVNATEIVISGVRYKKVTKWEKV